MADKEMTITGITPAGRMVAEIMEEAQALDLRRQEQIATQRKSINRMGKQLTDVRDVLNLFKAGQLHPSEAIMRIREALGE